MNEMTSENAVDIAKVRALYSAWISAVENGERDAYVALLDKNIRMTPPGAEDILSRDAYAEFLKPVFTGAEYKITRTSELEIEIFGDFAFTRYDYIIDITFKEGVVTMDQPGALTQASNNTKYSDVLLRQKDGGWKVWRHMWNDNIASDGGTP